jgi:predicted peroxiredoxin
MEIDTRKILHTAFDKHTKGVDHYNHNGSTWLIFTDEKKWVIEFTKEGTLWYNYYFFQNIMKLLSLEVVENQHYITEWVEETIQNGVRNTDSWMGKSFVSVEYTIQNGVKEIELHKGVRPSSVEHTIQNGVKQTKRSYEGSRKQRTKHTIQNGVKETKHNPFDDGLAMEEAIQIGIKKTKAMDEWVNTERIIENTIQNGVKETHSGCDLLIDDSIEGVIQNGVKHTEYGDWLDGDERFDDIIQNGVKETKTPGEDGDIMGALDFMSDNNTNNLSHLINDVIEKGIKQTEAAALFDETKVDRIISKGVKETKGGGYLGSIEMKGKIVHQLESPKQNEEVEDVIENGVRNTDWRALPMTRSVEDTIQNGIKETWGYEKQPQKRIDEVIMNGQKD